MTVRDVRAPSVVPQALACLCWLALATACPSKTNDEEAKTDRSAAKEDVDAAADGDDGPEETADAAPEPEGPSGVSVSADDPPAACDLLTPQIAASTLALPQTELRQVANNGCAYSKTSAEEEASVSLTGLVVAATPETAAARFTSMTRSITRKEATAIAAKAGGEKAEGESGTDAELSKAARTSKPAEMRFEDVEGVGDTARLNTTTGTVTVRAGNLLFSITAYKGARMQRPKAAGGDVTKLADKVRKARAKWVEDTMDTRKTLATQAAQAIIEGVG